MKTILVELCLIFIAAGQAKRTPRYTISVDKRREWAECRHSGRGNLFLHAHPGVDVMVLRVNQYHSIDPFTLNITSSSNPDFFYTITVNRVYRSRWFYSHKLFVSGLSRNSSYVVSVRTNAECPKRNAISASTLDQCNKKCTNGHCILKYSFETCHCASGFTPSPYQEPWGYEQCFPINGTCKLYSNETLCPAQSQCLQLSSGRFPKHRCVCNSGYGFGRVYSDNCCKKGCVRKFHKECMPCEQLEKYYLQVHAYSGPDAMLVDVLQKFIINSVRVTVSGKDYTASKTLYMTKDSKVRKKKVDVLFTGLVPETKYKIVVQSLGECSYAKKMKKATSKECTKSCINGKCISRRRGERCKCLDGYNPSKYGDKHDYEVCFPQDGSCSHPSLNLCPENSTCMHSRTNPGKFICQCNAAYGFDKRGKTCKPSRTIKSYKDGH